MSIATQEAKRVLSRESGRIVYDCWNAVVWKPNSVKCKKGYWWGIRKVSIPYNEVLNGYCATICQDCVDYKDGD